MAALSDRQQQYIWLMGSHPDKIAVQGRGRRTPELRWGIDGDELVLFGYSTPLLWLGRRLVARHGDQVALWEVCTPEKAAAYLSKPAGQHATLAEHLEYVLRQNPHALDEEIPA